VVKTVGDCTFAALSKKGDKIFSCGVSFVTAGLSCGVAIYKWTHDVEDSPDAPATAPRTLRMNATAGEQSASAAPTQNAAPTVATPARDEKAGPKGGKRGKNAKGGKGKKRSLAQVRGSNHDDDNNRTHARANSNQSHGKGHQTRSGNNDKRGKGHDNRGNAKNNQGKGAKDRGKGDHGRGHGNNGHGKGGKRR
jgi:hypothetical protein